MKKFLLISLAALLFSCEKLPLADPPPVFEFTATVNRTPSDKTQYYDLYATNDINGGTSKLLWVRKITYYEILAGKIFGFNYTAWVCNGETYDLDPKKKIYGATVETTWGNIQHPLDYSGITIK